MKASTRDNLSPITKENAMPNGSPTVHSRGGDDRVKRAHYSPPWANTSIIGIAGSSGSGKTSLSLAIIQELNLPWVVILSMDSFYKPLSAEQSAAAFRNEYDFDAPEAIDFDILVDRLWDIKTGYFLLALIYERLLMMRKAKGRYSRVFIRKAQQTGTNHDYLLASCLDSGRDFCTS